MRAVLGCAVAVLSVMSASCTSSDESTAPSHSAPAITKDRSASADALPLATLACGAQINSDVRLANDLTCTGVALVVAGDDIWIDLNGHTLAGNGTTDGITITASHDVRIFGGTVTGFVTGIFVGGSTGIVIRDNAFAMNRTAVLFQAVSGSIIKHNVVTNHTMRAFMLRPNLAGVQSTDNTIIGNEVSDTPTGIFLIRQPGNTIQANTITSSTIAGIDLGEGTGTVSDNIVRANHLVGGGAGIRFSAGWIANRFVGNRIESNTCGTKGSTAGNTLNGNVFSGNATDACP
jgi:parallel beta-helix repeat protein